MNSSPRRSIWANGTTLITRPWGVKKVNGDDAAVQVPYSDAKWYFDQFAGEREAFYQVFLRTCQKFGISWSSATEKEKRILEAIVRFTYQREAVQRKGIPLNTIKPAFDIPWGPTKPVK